MRYRQYELSDYETVVGWWEKHGWSRVHEYALSDEGIFIEDNEGNGLACGWYGRTNSKSALLEWLVTNPNNTNKQSFISLKMIEQIASTFAVNEGYKLLFMFLENNGLMKFMEKNGWMKGDTKMNIYTKGIA